MESDYIRVLLVEDHDALAQNLADFFDDSRYVIDFAKDGLTALHLLTVNSYDVVVLDVMLPGVSGFEICKRLRQDLKSLTPVIFMTARDQIEDKEIGYSSGGDDYLVKPFHLKELKFRIDAAYRRSQSGNSQLLVAGEIKFDPGTLRVTYNGFPPLELSGINAKLFEVLIRAFPNFISYQDLHDRVWGEREADLNALRTHVYNLRKLLQQTFDIGLIKTVHGRGYRLDVERE